MDVGCPELVATVDGANLEKGELALMVYNSGFLFIDRHYRLIKVSFVSKEGESLFIRKPLGWRRN